TEVWALLIEHHDAVGHPVEEWRVVGHALGLRQRVDRILRDPGSSCRVVEETAARVDAGEDVVELADVDLYTEATLGGRPQERHEPGRGERREAGSCERHGGAVEELSSADAQRFF